MPELFVWREEYALGLPEIDAQHEAIFALGRRLAGGEPVLADLASSVRNHFRTEEALMSGCTLCAAHRAEHQAFLAQLATPPPLAMVDAWIRQHMTGADRRLAEELAQRGR